MLTLSPEQAHSIITRTPTPLKEVVASVILSRFERDLLQNDSMDELLSNTWYYANRDPKNRDDHARMSLAEKIWVLVTAKTKERDRWINIMGIVGSMGAFEATNHIEELKESHSRSYLRFQDYLSNLESSPSSPNYAEGKELAATQTREEFFTLCRAATKDFTTDIPTDSQLYQQISLAHQLQTYRTGTMYQNVPSVLVSSL